MSLLTPLGLLGLLSLLVLLLIYILKPNYQQKVIPSTFIWKLSLKYKKKRLPISKLRNILLIICQVIIFTLAAFILTQPVNKADSTKAAAERVFIIDASGSMLAQNSGDITRFERAVRETKAMAEETLAEDDGKVTVILAGRSAELLCSRTDSSGAWEVRSTLDSLVEDGLDCTYGNSDIKSAMELADSVLLENAEAEVVLVTDTEYIEKNGVTVVNVADPEEYNAAILAVTAATEENYYVFDVDVACYNRDAFVIVTVDVIGANTDRLSISFDAEVNCVDDKTQRVHIVTANTSTPVYSYDYLYVHIDAADALPYDNSFYLYGGTKTPIKVLYASTLRNPFFSSALLKLADILSPAWDLQIRETIVTDTSPADTEGYDLYIFEHTVPSVVPPDGVVLFVDPTSDLGSIGLRTGSRVTGNFTLAPGDTHPITAYMDPAAVTIVEYVRIMAEDGYSTLMYCGGDPIFLVKNEPRQKFMVLSLDLNKSNLAMLKDFPIMMYNMFGYFFPPTLGGRVFDVDDSIDISARGEEITVQAPAEYVHITQLPATYSVETPGVYAVLQTLISGAEQNDPFYVKIPAAQSNICSVQDELVAPISIPKKEYKDDDLIVWFALAAVILLMAEWLLHTREQI